VHPACRRAFLVVLSSQTDTTSYPPSLRLTLLSLNRWKRTQHHRRQSSGVNATWLSCSRYELHHELKSPGIARLGRTPIPHKSIQRMFDLGTFQQVLNKRTLAGPRRFQSTGDCACFFCTHTSEYVDFDFRFILPTAGSESPGRMATVTLPCLQHLHLAALIAAERSVCRGCASDRSYYISVRTNEAACGC
jgi:hypothetical protein